MQVNIHRLWAFTAKPRSDSSELKHNLVSPGKGMGSTEDQAQRVTMTQEGSCIVSKGLITFGVTTPASDATPYNQTNEQTYRE